MISELFTPHSRKCHACEISKPVSQFYSQRKCNDCHNSKRRSRRNGPLLARQCEVCQRTFLPKRYRKARTCSQTCRGRIRELRLHGLTPSKFRQLVELQHNRCVICRRKPKDKLVVHHCHRVSVFLGLVCHTCNAALGMFMDDSRIVKRALEFTEGTNLFETVARK